MKEPPLFCSSAAKLTSLAGSAAGKRSLYIHCIPGPTGSVVSMNRRNNMPVCIPACGRVTIHSFARTAAVAACCGLHFGASSAVGTYRGERNGDSTVDAEMQHDRTPANQCQERPQTAACSPLWSHVLHVVGVMATYLDQASSCRGHVRDVTELKQAMSVYVRQSGSQSHIQLAGHCVQAQREALQSFRHVPCRGKQAKWAYS